VYLEHFHFSSEPFSIVPDPRFLFLSKRHEEALAHLLYGLREGGGFVALTGEVGTGKTTLCHYLMEQLPDNVDLALVLNPKLSSLELISSLCDELGIKYPEDNTSIKIVVDALNHYLLAAHARGRRTVVLIDEAQNLNLDVLEQIRLLTNLETKETKLLQILLVGQPELNNLLNCKELRQLSQRITGRYHLIALNFKETKDYVRHRIGKVGGETDLFSSGALAALFKRSRGIPRLVNTIADRSLLGAYGKNEHQVSVGLVNNAANEILNTGRQSPWRAMLIGMLLSFTMVAFGWMAWNYRHNINEHIPQLFNRVENVNSGATTSLPATTKTQTTVETSKTKEIVKIPPAVELPKNKDTAITDQLNPAQPLPQQLLSDVIEQHSLTLPEAFSSLLSINGLGYEEINTANICDLAKQKGYACLIDRTNWRQILQFNRPVILELENTNSKKYHVVLKKVVDNQVQLDLGEYSVFTAELNQLVSLWNGNYVQLVKIPGKGKYILRVGDRNKNVVKLRQMLVSFNANVLVTKTPAYYDKALARLVIQYQAKKGLVADGVVGPKTWLLLDNTINTKRPRLILKDD
jgi:general secretion pathway protein A